MDLKTMLDRETYKRFEEISTVKRISTNELLKKPIKEYVNKNQVIDKETMGHLDMVHQYKK